MTVEEMDRVARGRVWTGGDALARGLVDELGGLDVAVRLAVEGLKPKEGEKISIISYPPPLSTGEMLSMLMKGPQNSDSVNSSVPGVVWSMAIRFFYSSTPSYFSRMMRTVFQSINVWEQSSSTMVCPTSLSIGQ
mmetsp:Transcript_2789/g.3712  ORF Transcript_2789/g.3712 Transcript_2789/m.3712 type:complete len:135 (+) Transcript_2789:893-1297(+)